MPSRGTGIRTEEPAKVLESSCLGAGCSLRTSMARMLMVTVVEAGLPCESRTV